MTFGQKPDGMMVNVDVDFDGILDYDDVLGQVTLDPDDDIYVAGNFFGFTSGIAYGSGKVVGGIEFNGVLNDITQLPAWPGVGVTDVPLPTINLTPEPGTLALLAGGVLALLRRRRKPAPPKRS